MWPFKKPEPLYVQKQVKHMVEIGEVDVYIFTRGTRWTRTFKGFIDPYPRDGQPGPGHVYPAKEVAECEISAWNNWGHVIIRPTVKPDEMMLCDGEQPTGETVYIPWSKVRQIRIGVTRPLQKEETYYVRRAL